MFEKPVKYIRYTICYGSLPDTTPHEEKTITRIYPDGLIEIREYEGKKVTSLIRKKVSKEKVKKLINDIPNPKGEYNLFCGGARYTAIVFEDRSVSRDLMTPSCLDDFVMNLNSTPVMSLM